MKRILFAPGVQGQLRAIPQATALSILHAVHRYADSGHGDIKAMQGEFAGTLRLRVGSYRVLFKESPDAITVRRIAIRGDVYR